MVTVWRRPPAGDPELQVATHCHWQWQAGICAWAARARGHGPGVACNPQVEVVEATVTVKPPTSSQGRCAGTGRSWSRWTWRPSPLRLAVPAGPPGPAGPGLRVLGIIVTVLPLLLCVFPQAVQCVPSDMPVFLYRSYSIPDSAGIAPSAVTFVDADSDGDTVRHGPGGHGVSSFFFKFRGTEKGGETGEDVR
jgi:hypothetical protein